MKLKFLKMGVTMNQIIYSNNSLPPFSNDDSSKNNTSKNPSNNHYIKNPNQKYKILFMIFSSIAFVAIIFMFAKLYQNNQNSILSQKLTDSYAISTLYANTTNYQAEVQESSTTAPFVIGIIKIDKINVNYSILSISNNDLLDISVCRFAGPMPNEIGNLCIAGHNYVDYKFFSRLNELNIDDEIKIYDLTGNYITYKIYDIYETKSNDTSCTFQNTNNTRIVTLVTCNNVNGKRLVVHAKEIP